MRRLAHKLLALASLVAIIALAGCGGGSTTGKGTTPTGIDFSMPKISAPVVQQTAPPAAPTTPGEEREPEPTPNTPAPTQPSTPSEPTTPPTSPTTPTCPT